jgi:cytochrome c556
MKNKSFLAACVILFLAIPFVGGHAADPESKKVQALMKRKLTAAQKVLEGIAVNDYGEIGQNARELIEISKAVEWRVFKTPQYEINSNDFRRSADNLIQAAKAKNVDAAALAYVDLTLSCVRCHKHVREVRQARLDAEPAAQVAAGH